MLRKLCPLICLLALASAGCQRDGDARPRDDAPANGNATENADKAPAGAVTLKVVKHNELLKELQTFKGKVVLVDFWATFCIPCKEKFPKVVKLYNEHRDDGLVCVSVSIDEPDSTEAAESFLQKSKAVFPNYLVDESDPAVYQNHWKFRAVPAYYVLDRNGELAKDGVFADVEELHFEDIEKVVLAHLRTK